MGAKIKCPEAQNQSYLFCTRLKEIQKLAHGHNLQAIRIISTFSEAFSACAYKRTCSCFDVSITVDVCLRTLVGRRREGEGHDSKTLFAVGTGKAGKVRGWRKPEGRGH